MEYIVIYNFNRYCQSLDDIRREKTMYVNCNFNNQWIIIEDWFNSFQVDEVQAPIVGMAGLISSDR